MNSVQHLQCTIEKIWTHLDPLLPLANCHMVDFFTGHIYRKHVSAEIQEEVRANPNNVMHEIFEKTFTKLPTIQKYFENSLKYTLENCNFSTNLHTFHEKLQELGCDNLDSLKLKIFMSQKKSHEVEITSAVIAALREIKKVTHVIDLGDGKGYLSSMLALHHKIPVLGIDANPSNSNAAQKRVGKLEKIWHSVYENPKKSVLKKSEMIPFNKSPYKQHTQFIENDFNLEDILRKSFDQENFDKVGLCGLHTCGNLASTSLELFHRNECVKILCNIGCCYHLLDEKCEKSQKYGFPMSKFCTRRDYKIGRNARMVASQSTHRIFHEKKLPEQSIFYRALLQVLIEKENCETHKNVGKIKKEYTNFVEYARIALIKLELTHLNQNISDEELEKLFNEYEKFENELNLFYLIRSMTSPIIESLILLDRLMFLLENGYENTFLVRLFDPVVSPRCYGLISVK